MIAQITRDLYRPYSLSRRAVLNEPFSPYVYRRQLKVRSRKSVPWPLVNISPSSHTAYFSRGPILSVFISLLFFSFLIAVLPSSSSLPSLQSLFQCQCTTICLFQITSSFSFHAAVKVFFSMKWHCFERYSFCNRTCKKVSRKVDNLYSALTVTIAQLSLGKADRTSCARTLANVNVLTYLHNLLYSPNDNFRQLPQILANCGQTAADSDMVTIDSLQEFIIALSNRSIADPLYDVPFSHNT